MLDPRQTLPVLERFTDCFERLLGCMDAADGPGLEAILFSEMAPEDDFVRQVLDLVRSGAAGEPRRLERGCSCHPTWSLPECLVCQPVGAP